MFRKNALKIFIFSLCALLIAPIFSLKGSVANASTPDSVVAPRGVEFVYDTGWENVDSKVLVTVNGVEVYKDGAKITEISNAEVKSAIVTMSFSAGKLTASFGKTGNYVLVFSDTTENTTNAAKTVNLKISNSASDFTGKLTYKTDADSIKAYQEEVTKAAKSDEKSLKVGDTFTIPSFEKLLNTANIAYSSLNKTVYYAASGANYYSTATSTFEISTVGEYKLYAVFNTDELIVGDADSVLSISTKFLEEKEDGFYKATLNGTQVYASKHETEYKYYVDEELETEIQETDYANVKTDVLVIPVFKFTIDNTAPTVKSDSTYQEKGYIDYEYTSVSFTAKGNDITTTYVLEYSSDEGATWNVAEEELSSTLAFTPTKKGYYRVIATVTDCVGNVVSAKTENIIVDGEFYTVEFKTSFADWLSVNTVPFIFLCISAAALIGLIVVIAIPVKEKKEEDNKAEESDK